MSPFLKLDFVVSRAGSLSVLSIRLDFVVSRAGSLSVCPIRLDFVVARAKKAMSFRVFDLKKHSSANSQVIPSRKEEKQIHIQASLMNRRTVLSNTTPIHTKTFDTETPQPAINAYDVSAFLASQVSKHEQG